MKSFEGQKASDFSLPDQDGMIHSLSEFAGKWILLFFYQKDDTIGCTKEVCGIRDNFSHFQQCSLIVIGISADSVISHKKFTEKYNLPFLLLSDEQKQTVKEYEVWKPKKFLGKEFLGIVRTSFLINPEGVIEKIYENVNPKFHTKEVIEDFKALSEDRKMQ